MEKFVATILFSPSGQSIMEYLNYIDYIFTFGSKWKDGQRWLLFSHSGTITIEMQICHATVLNYFQQFASNDQNHRMQSRIGFRKLTLSFLFNQFPFCMLQTFCSTLFQVWETIFKSCRSKLISEVRSPRSPTLSLGRRLFPKMK